MTEEHAYKLKDIMHKAAISLNDEDALEAVELFPLWEVGVEYVLDVRVRYLKKLYKCVQAHLSQENWTPDIAPALWTEVAKPGEIPVWKQPTGVQDAYNTGDLVYYPTKDDFVYRCLIDNNTWSPIDYPQGWELIN